MSLLPPPCNASDEQCRAAGTAPNSAATELSEGTMPTIFPLPLTPFERYLSVDCRPAYPMTIVFEFLFTGPFDEAQLEVAAQQAVSQQPLLTARLSTTGAYSAWAAGQSPNPAIQWVARSDLANSVGARIAPARQPPLRMKACRVANNFVLQVVAHHSVTDGIGIRDFAAGIFHNYRRLSNSESASKPRRELDPLKLRARGKFEIATPEPISRLTATRFLAREVTRFFCRRIRRLESKPRPGDCGSQPMLTARLPQSLAQSIADFAKTSEASVNSLILAALFQTVRQWTAASGQSASKLGRADKWVRILMPVNLRGRQDRRMPAANKIGYAFLDRHESDCQDARKLIAGIDAEVSEIQRWSLAALFVDSIRKIDRVPGALLAMTRLTTKSATVICSNMGNMKRVFTHKASESSEDSLALHSIAAVPPVRPGAGAAIGITQVGDQLYFSLARDPQRFSAEDSDKLLKALVGNLAELADFPFEPASLELTDGLANALD